MAWDVNNITYEKTKTLISQWHVKYPFEVLYTQSGKVGMTKILSVTTKLSRPKQQASKLRTVMLSVRSELKPKGKSLGRNQKEK